MEDSNRIQSSTSPYREEAKIRACWVKYPILKYSKIGQDGEDYWLLARPRSPASANILGALKFCVKPLDEDATSTDSRAEL